MLTSTTLNTELALEGSCKAVGGCHSIYIQALTNRYTLYYFFRENRKAITHLCLMSVGSTEITVPRHGAA